MADIRSIRPEPEFIVHVGDIAEEAGDREAWKEFVVKGAPFTTAPARGVLYDPGKGRCFVLPGERDVVDRRTESDFLKLFFQCTASLPFSFDRDPFHFVVLNSERTDDSWLMRYFGFNRQKNRISGDQLEWLEKDLVESQGKRIMVFLHKPMFPPVFSAHDGYCLDQYPLERQKLLNLLDKYSVEAVFMGHDPVFHWTRIGKTYHIITGGGGRRPKAPKRHGGFHHFLYVTMDEASRTKVFCLDPDEDAVRGEIELR
jgi:3',5'-cyclic AMP phosphodiesterase CpdA